jgi:hypothetical protein
MTAGELIGGAIAGTVAAVLQACARAGATAEELEAAKAHALAELQSIDAARVAQEAREWRIARGETA